MKQVMVRAMLAGAMSALAFAAAAQEISWRVPTSVPEGSPYYGNFLVRFADNVELLTDGRVGPALRRRHPGPSVGGLRGRQGRHHRGRPFHPNYLVNQNPENAIFSGFPGGMGPEAYTTWIYEAGGKDALEKLRAEEGLKSLVVGIGSSGIMAHSNKPIKMAADLKGLKYHLWSLGRG